ncbi:hypothetical protein SJAV_00310 [Sulfurisphaera javensis]|uniref:Uncharacterized protein n=1 Tax=Sulfurisphaera javensis TaxID=2049879 RepID=A0AAT9GMG5_9CREN
MSILIITDIRLECYEYFKNELDYAKDYFNIYKSLKSRYDRKVIIINLWSAIEELSKYIYISLLRNCAIRLLSEEIEKYGILAFHEIIKRINNDLKNLHKEHEFKYRFFLFFYTYYSNRIEGKEIIPKDDEIDKEAKKISEIRKVYLSTGEENKIPDEEIIKLSDELEQKVEFILNHIKSNILVLDESL